MEIKDRVTIRLNEREKLELQQIALILKEEDISKLLKFSIKWTNHNIKKVTEQLVPNDYDVVFLQKRKTNKLNKKIY